jgi:hypothetical protein
VVVIVEMGNLASIDDNQQSLHAAVDTDVAAVGSMDSN